MPSSALKLVASRAIALLLGIFASLVFAKCSLGAITTPDLRVALGVVVGCAAALLGFLVSAGALLYAVANTTLARNMQRTGHFQDLLEDLFAAAIAFFIALVVGVSCLFVPSPYLNADPIRVFTFSRFNFGMIITVFANATAYSLLVPLGRKMWLLLSNLQPEKSGSLE